MTHLLTNSALQIVRFSSNCALSLGAPNFIKVDILCRPKELIANVVSLFRCNELKKYMFVIKSSERHRRENAKWNHLWNVRRLEYTEYLRMVDTKIKAGYVIQSKIHQGKGS